MEKQKILFILGTRPEAIKLAPLILQSQKYQDWQTEVCFTGQHDEIVMPVLNFFSIFPNYHLRLFRPRKTLSSLIQILLQNLENVMAQSKPNIVIVQGDTSSAFAGGLSSFYHKIPIGHVEAGLRTHEKYQPFPEEINRSFLSRIADWNFCPTKEAGRNLLKENIPNEKIFITGNTIVDAINRVSPTLSAQSHPIFSELIQSKRLIITVTAHRRENFGTPLHSICNGILELVRLHPEIEVVWLLHPNPEVKQIVTQKLANTPRIRLIPPLAYFEFLSLIKLSYFLVSDSGGVQEEAPSFGKPVLIIREVTERPEAVQEGGNRIVGTESSNIVNEASRLLKDRQAYEKMIMAKNPFGDGLASKRILQILEPFLLGSGK